MSPEATKINTRLWNPRLCDEQPRTKNWFGQHIKNGIGDNFAIDAEDSGAFGYAPDTSYHRQSDRCVSYVDEE
jgi:hypothetical protein